MLQIKVDNQFLDVGDASIPLKFTNPMFQDEALNNAFSYGFNLPVTPRNQAIFKNAERLDNTADDDNFPCEIIFAGISFLDGILAIQNPNNSSYSCFINNEGLSLTKSLGAFNIRDLDLESVHQFDVHPNPIAPIQIRWDFLENSFQTIKNDQFNNDDIDDNYCWPPVLVEEYGYNEGTPAPFRRFNYTFRYINPFVQNSYHYNHPFATTTIEEIFWSMTSIPFVKYGYVLKELFKTIGLTFVSGFLDTTDMKQLSMFNRFTSDAAQPVTEFNGLKQDIKLEDFLPDITGLDLVTVLKTEFNHILFITNNLVEVVSVNDILNTPEEDISKYTNDDYSFNRINNEGFTFKYDKDDNDALYSNPDYTPVEVVIGEGKTKTISPNRYLFVSKQRASIAWPLWTTYPGLTNFVTDALGETGTMGIYRAPLKSDAYPSGLLNAFGVPFVDISGPDDHLKNIVFTFYRGKQLNTLGNPYPLATPFDTEETIGKVGELSLAWDGENGLYNKFHRVLVEETDKAKEITKLLDLPVHKVKEFSGFRKPIKKSNHQNGQMRGILKDLSVTLNRNSISKSTCTFISKQESDLTIS